MQTVKTINFLLMCLFFACYMYQFLYIPVSWLPRRREKREAPLHRFAILIAACDEEAVIGNLLDSIKAQSYPERFLKVFVAADNCRDKTAVTARARGAKRPTSPWRGILAEFSPLLIGWSGGGATKNLTKVEWMGGFSPIEGDALLSGFYMNELILRLTAKEDPEEGIFDAYWEALRVLSGQEPGDGVEVALRRFEMQLLRLTGYGFPSEFQNGYYVLRGAELVRAGDEPSGSEPSYPATSLREMAKLDFSRPETARAAKTLLRAQIAAVAGDRPLSSRRIIAELKRL